VNPGPYRCDASPAPRRRRRRGGRADACDRVSRGHTAPTHASDGLWHRKALVRASRRVDRVSSDGAVYDRRSFVRPVGGTHVRSFQVEHDQATRSARRQRGKVSEAIRRSPRGAHGRGDLTRTPAPDGGLTARRALPTDNRAGHKKGPGELGASLRRGYYEGCGPGGVAILVRRSPTASDVADVEHLTKFAGTWRRRRVGYLSRSAGHRDRSRRRRHESWRRARGRGGDVREAAISRGATVRGFSGARGPRSRRSGAWASSHASGDVRTVSACCDAAAARGARGSRRRAERSSNMDIAAEELEQLSA